MERILKNSILDDINERSSFLYGLAENYAQDNLILKLFLLYESKFLSNVKNRTELSNHLNYLYSIKNDDDFSENQVLLMIVLEEIEFLEIKIEQWFVELKEKETI